MILPSYWRTLSGDLQYLFDRDLDKLNSQFIKEFLQPYWAPLNLQEYGYIVWKSITFDIRRYTNKRKKLSLSPELPNISHAIDPVYKQAEVIKQHWIDLSKAYAWIINKELDLAVYFLGSSEEGLPDSIKQTFQRYYVYKALEVLNQ